MRKAIVVTHGTIRGPAHELRDYFRNSYDETIFIHHPLLFIKQNRILSSGLERYEKGKLVFERKAFHWEGPEPLLYLKDLLYTLIWVIRYGRKTDLLVGSGNLNAFAGLILKRLGVVKKVVYYCIDYVPNRFKSKPFNNIYHWVDKYCAEKCDSTWNLSSRMIEGRQKKWKQKFPHQRVVPHGSYTDQYTKSLVSLTNYHEYEIVFMGTLLKKQGIQLVINVLSRIIKKFPKTKLSIVGSGDYENNLKALTKELGLQRQVIFYGCLADKETKQKLAKAHVAVAPYNKDEDIFTYYSDPGKVKYYLSLGIPVIITDVPLVAKDLEREKCGIIIEYRVDSLANSIEKFFDSKKLTVLYRKNALEYAKKFGWKIIYSKAIEDL